MLMFILTRRPRDSSVLMLSSPRSSSCPDSMSVALRKLDGGKKENILRLKGRGRVMDARWWGTAKNDASELDGNE